MANGFGALTLMMLPSGRVFADEAPSPILGEPIDFSRTRLLEFAQKLSKKPYAPASYELPPGLRELSYDQYRDIRFKDSAALFGSDGSRFRADLLHSGFFFDTPVSIFIVNGGKARPVRYSTDLFQWGKLVEPPPPETELPFSGFRLRHPINRPDIWDEFAVFQGASYFRAIAKGQIYGLSARGLALNTAEPEGEEFPAFTNFWLERPDPQAMAFTCHALLESPSCTGVYTFLIRPGAKTVMDVELSLFPRRELKMVGLAPLTSMFLQESSRRNRIDDFRPAVHDSDGLEILTGSGERIWRPLINPPTLQISSFIDRSPIGFGLAQRARRFEHYQDLEARYEKRPGAWIEPVGDWGPGSVMLFEIPTDREIHDNIVAFWRPAAAIPANAEFRATYRITWCEFSKSDPSLAQVEATRIGPNFDHTATQFVVDFAPAQDMQPDPTMDVSAAGGEIQHATVQANPESGGYRAKFELKPQSDKTIELRLRLLHEDAPASETWLYRWMPQ